MPHDSMIHITRILFEISFPVSFMVSSLVTFVLIPYAKKAKMPIDNFFVIVPLLMHNANIVFMAIELIVNKIPFALWHFPIVVMYGLLYAMFSWTWNYHKGYYFYYFMDYTRRGAIYWYIGLIVIAGVFFLLGVGCSRMMSSSADSVLPSLVSKRCAHRCRLSYSYSAPVPYIISCVNTIQLHAYFAKCRLWRPSPAWLSKSATENQLNLI